MGARLGVQEHARARQGVRRAGRCSGVQRRPTCARLANVCAGAQLCAGTVHPRARSSLEMKKST
ncbi:hypothetical protein CRG98_023564 [Punica granatum]|uniref:Uncharacterized protein n=1 Tax=Punica granatum TaxID=22663 RepID=A0A2I0JIH6_PUNGR|nr:hypothetical protein CRG98_023564 [Punica granatum]